MTLNKNIGRPKGSMSKRSLNFIRKLSKYNCEPEAFLAHVTNGDFAALGFTADRNPITLDHRIAAAKALMPYRWPALKAMEVEHVNPPAPMIIQMIQFTKPPVDDGSDAKVINGTVGAFPGTHPMPFPPPRRYANGSDEG